MTDEKKEDGDIYPILVMRGGALLSAPSVCSSMVR